MRAQRRFCINFRNIPRPLQHWQVNRYGNRTSDAALEWDKSLKQEYQSQTL